MRKETDNQNHGKALNFNLPQIRPAKSMPIIPPTKEFDLRLVHIQMPPYQPEKDKFLSQYFERQTRIRTLSSSESHSKKSLKTEPSMGNKLGEGMKQSK